jgi:2-dehydro-3-deoxy-D-arabinonate dehydratase
MSTALWRVRAAGAVRLARGPVDDGPVELLDPSLTVASFLADPHRLLHRLDLLTGAGVVPADALVLVPLDAQPVWAAGVTFQRSRQARREEATDGGDVYDRVYTADRPELFYKAAAGAAVGTGGRLGIRADSDWNVPEPELGVVAGPDGKVQALVLGNDMSSRSIEGANPLYLPQAKVYDRSCGIGPCLVPLSTAPAWHDLRIEVSITRGSELLYRDAMGMAEMRRTPDELLKWLFAAQSFPQGVVLLTGTSLVPPADVSLRPGDEVVVRAAGLGSLRNTVIRVGTAVPEATAESVQ